MMETSKPGLLSATPEKVRAGEERQVENPSGAAIWKLKRAWDSETSKKAGFAKR